MKKYGIIIFATIFLIGVDQITKLLIVENIALHHQIKIIDNFFWLTYVQNTGAAWSIFSSSTVILAIISFSAALAMIWYMVTKKLSTLQLVSLVFMLSGTVGNGIDRLLHGFVVDMLAFNLLGYHFPVFNVADICLVVGVILFCLESLRLEKINGSV